MKRRLISVVLFAVLAAALSSTLLYNIISSNSRSAPKAATRPVLVAARNLDAGVLIGEGDVHPVDWPVTDGSPWLVKRSDVVGRALLTPVTKDEPFAETRLAAKGAAVGLASRIPPGMRAVAVHVDELTGLSRFILPGMHVDVISTGSAGGFNNQGLVTRTILQNVEVFSTGQATERDAKDRPTVPVFNLLVTPQQAEILSQAVAQTRIALVLRNPLDKENFLSEVIPPVPLPPAPAPKPSAPTAPPPVEEKPVVRVEPPPPPPAPAPTVEVIHGTKRTVSPVAAAPGTEHR